MIAISLIGRGLLWREVDGVCEDWQCQVVCFVSPHARCAWQKVWRVTRPAGVRRWKVYLACVVFATEAQPGIASRQIRVCVCGEGKEKRWWALEYSPGGGDKNQLGDSISSKGVRRDWRGDSKRCGRNCGCLLLTAVVLLFELLLQSPGGIHACADHWKVSRYSM